MIRLVLRLDAVAALRRGPHARSPDLHAAAHAALLGGADAVRLRLADEAEALALRERLDGALHLDVAPSAGEVEAALRVKPARACLWPEHAAANPANAASAWAGAIDALRKAGIGAGIRLPASEAAILAANEAGAEWVDLDTFPLADATSEGARLREFVALKKAAATAGQLGLRVTLGGRLGPALLARVAPLPEVEEAHVGFVAVSRAIFVGLAQAVRDLKHEVVQARAERAFEARD
jgi:pyridoxine 5-phosphate synthase